MAQTEHRASQFNAPHHGFPHGIVPGTMKTIFLLVLMSLSLVACSSAEKAAEEGKKQMTEMGKTASAWSVTEVQNPESAYFHAPTQTIFVSNVAGNPTDKDGKGWISKFDKNGKVIQAQWVTGFHAPKGMRADDKTLWVSNIDELVGIEISTGKIIQRTKIPGAKFLNDVAIGPKGEVFVSDTLGNKIYSVTKGKVSTFMKGETLESPNGLLVQGNTLYVASWGAGMTPDWKTKTPGHIYKIDLTSKKKTLVTPEPLGNLDGLEMDSQGGFIVSDWMAGKVFRVTQAGAATLFLEGFQGSADIGVMPETHTLIVPRMGENQVSAYSLPERS
jgi:sugar lactone lactonase YvrE